MERKPYAINLAVLKALGFLLPLSMAAAAQEVPSEISVLGTGFFTEDSNGNGVLNQGTGTGGVLVGYRHSINLWLATEANYGYARNTQNFFGPVPGSLDANIHEVTGAAPDHGRGTDRPICRSSCTSECPYYTTPAGTSCCMRFGVDACVLRAKHLP